MKIETIDHIVLTVTDIQETVRFYESVLGMRADQFGTDRIALKFGDQKINLHQQGNEFEPKAERATPGSVDVCFLTSTRLEKAMEHVKERGVEIVEGPVSRTGAGGPITSFYIRDPDGNLIEIANHLREG